PSSSPHRVAGVPPCRQPHSRARRPALRPPFRHLRGVAVQPAPCPRLHPRRRHVRPAGKPSPRSSAAASPSDMLQPVDPAALAQLTAELAATTYHQLLAERLAARIAELQADGVTDPHVAMKPPRQG